MQTPLILSFMTVVLSLTACTSKKAQLGTEQNPIKMFFVPSVDAKVIEDNSKAFQDYLEKNTPYRFSVSMPQSYIAVVEAFGTKRADVATFNTFGYILAHEKYGAQARLTVLRNGSPLYQSQFIARTESSIRSIADLQGKKLAFVDASSASGYLLPLKVLRDHKVQPGETVFAGKHDNVVSMVYNRQADAGATFYSPPDKNGIQDARYLVRTQYPDVEKKIKIIALTDAIPTDPIVFRNDMPEEMKQSIIQALLKFITTPEGKVAFQGIYAADGLKTATDADYDQVRVMLKALGKDAAQLLKQ